MVFQCRQRTDHTTTSYAKAYANPKCESVENTRQYTVVLVCRRSIIARKHKGRVIFAAMACGENPGPSGTPKTWQTCVVDDLEVFRATERSTEHCLLVFRVAAMLREPRQTRRRASGTGGFSMKSRNSWPGYEIRRRGRACSATHPPWMGLKGEGVEGKQQQAQGRRLQEGSAREGSEVSGQPL